MTDTFEYKYIDKDESIFILSLLKNIDCEHCPDFYKGCIGSYTKQEMVTIPTQRYLEFQKPGTEKYMCGKLRNIYLLNEAHTDELNKQYNEEVDKQIAFLSKIGDKIHIETMEANKRIRQLEIESNERLKKMEIDANSKITQFVSQANQITNIANKKVEEMQGLVKILQNRLNISESQLDMLKERGKFNGGTN